ncbi:exodeoxyribonuclease V subunit beta [Stenoxybacter acetivorans]|uniref:exodeoxyribonuclease V subunit beta n=1 Tax=Stenoxybacter acetivorans TaxID=422441 RepID=UPI0005625F2B|nr:exodeoxyribonuclease V subunit beta [Stenoxybacter acetivorans]
MTAHTFNPLTLPLNGNILIEASAGTGKTYNIAALFARLILLEKMTVDRVLVVTFTKAATAELKIRLRSRLNEALLALRSQRDDGKPPEDDFLRDLLLQALSKESSEKLILRLQAAISQFDQAAIYTIHGFCQRVLTDYAFWCQTPFDTETAEPNPQLLLTFAQDYWRSHISDDPLLAALVIRNKLTPHTVIEQLGKWVNRTELHPRTPPLADLASLQKRVNDIWQSIHNRLPEMETVFWQIYPKLSGTKFKEKTYQSVFAQLRTAAECCRDGDNIMRLRRLHNDLGETPDKCPRLTTFDTEYLRTNTKKNNVLNDTDLDRLAPLSAFADACRALMETEEHAAIRLQLDCFEYVHQQQAQHKQHSRQRSFDDLLNDTAQALSDHNPHHHLLAQALAAQWQIALLDEFQDTDPLQYRIFQTAFSAQNRPLLMVGDPKQAIYGFRGADIHAYLQAAADTPIEQRYTLNTNYRSHEALIQSVSYLFSGSPKPFVLDGIPYPPIHASRTQSRLTPNSAAFRIRWLNSSDEKSNKDVLRRRAADWCAAEIAAQMAQSLSGSLNITDEQGNTRPIAAGDIAVLVRKHSESRLMAHALKQHGIVSVSLNNQSVFDTEHARLMAALLTFLQNPQKTDLLRFILGSPLYAFNAAALQQLNHNDTAIDTWIQRGAATRECWQKNGIYAALQQFAAASDLEHSLLQRRDERGITNFWQLAELLSDTEQTITVPQALINWLNRQITDHTRPNGENTMLRLESDEQLVKIVTMHAAKGLEYPIVYCPFAWDADSNSQTWSIVHQHQQTELIHKNLLSTDDTAHQTTEQLSESLRLYYVALTRAREQITLYAADSSAAKNNALIYLITNGKLADDISKTAIQTTWQDCLNQAPQTTDFAWFTDAPAAAASFSPPPAKQTYQANALPHRRFQFIRQTSFTALSRSHNSGEAMNPDIDAAEITESADTPVFRQPENQAPETALLGFARGMNAGVCLHALLEETDFSHNAADQVHRYPPLLAQYGFADTHAEIFIPMIEAVRQCRLSANSCLANIPTKQRLAEMGFTLHLHDFSVSQLQHWFANTPHRLPENIVQTAHLLDFDTVNGFLNGFIDLSCQDHDGNVYVIDYKSNYLGSRLADYHTEAMNHEVAKHHYYLQALIYAIALARHLQLKNALPDSIQVRYLFLRGLSEHRQEGIWCWDIATEYLHDWLI